MHKDIPVLCLSYDIAIFAQNGHRGTASDLWVRQHPLEGSTYTDTAQVNSAALVCALT